MVVIRLEQQEIKCTPGFCAKRTVGICDLGTCIFDVKQPFETGVRNGFQGWQAWFKIDQQTFFLQTNLDAAPEENTEAYAKWQEENLKVALFRLIENAQTNQHR